MFKIETIYNRILSKLVIMTFIISGIALGASWSEVAEACTPIPETSLNIGGFTNLTAALVNPGAVDAQDVDATGCNLGIYFSPGESGSVSNSTVHGANIVGIVNNGANVPITSNDVYQIGEVPFNGSQHGLGIYASGLDNPVNGDIKFNTVWAYQKGGIVVKAANGLDVLNNTVIGLGPVPFIGQNGIQVSYGKNSFISGNHVFGNSYSGANFASSGGILLFGGCGIGDPQTFTTVTGNDLEGNDVGVFSVNVQDDCVTPVDTQTRNTIQSNTIRNNGIFNTTGGGDGAYQAGVSIEGTKDKIVNNSICGIGYTPVDPTPPYIYDVDVDYANSPTVSNNNCNDGNHHGNHHGRKHRKFHGPWGD